MSKGIKPERLASAIKQQLGDYSAEVQGRVNDAGLVSTKEIVKKARAAAPKNTGHFKKSLGWGSVQSPKGDKTYRIGAYGSAGRLTHLLVHGHATRNGGRTQGDPFLKNALDTVLPKYEKAIEEAIKND